MLIWLKPLGLRGGAVLRERLRQAYGARRHLLLFLFTCRHKR